jgi:hypothetical protein
MEQLDFITGAEQPLENVSTGHLIDEISRGSLKRFSVARIPHDMPRS